VKLLVGLGNPGREYANTRHNVGFMVIDRLASILRIPVKRLLFRTLTGQGEWAGEKIILAKPQTYMNLSGEAAGALLNWYKPPLSGFLVIYDDLDLPAGRLRLRPQGGAGGHKGMQSIIRLLGTDAFPRLRVGIGRPQAPCPESDFVLKRFTLEEAEKFTGIVEYAAEAAQCFVSEGMEQAMNRYNAYI